MKIWVSVLPILMSVIVLTGCWDKSELPDFGYVQALAIDNDDKAGRIMLTTHFYRPSGGGDTGSSGRQQNKGFNILTSGDTFFEAVRDIPTQLGRKAKFDHMRIILISEKVAQTQNIGDILEFFLRDHEPRATVPTAIVQGKASSALAVKPFIEITISQQLREINEMTYKYAAKAPLVPLLDLAIQLRSETAVALLPFISLNDTGKQLSANGIALVKKGKMTSKVVHATNAKILMMMINQFKTGTLNIPCSTDKDSQKKKESFEVIKLDTKLLPIIHRNKLTVQVSTTIKGSINELRCSTLKTTEEGKK